MVAEDPDLEPLPEEPLPEEPEPEEPLPEEPEEPLRTVVVVRPPWSSPASWSGPSSAPWRPPMLVAVVPPVVGVLPGVEEGVADVDGVVPPGPAVEAVVDAVESSRVAGVELDGPASWPAGSSAEERTGRMI